MYYEIVLDAKNWSNQALAPLTKISVSLFVVKGINVK
jgi:hypothetical protein